MIALIVLLTLGALSGGVAVALCRRRQAQRRATELQAASTVYDEEVAFDSSDNDARPAVRKVTMNPLVNLDNSLHEDDASADAGVVELAQRPNHRSASVISETEEFFHNPLMDLAGHDEDDFRGDESDRGVTIMDELEAQNAGGGMASLMMGGFDSAETSNPLMSVSIKSEADMLTEKECLHMAEASMTVLNDFHDAMDIAEIAEISRDLQPDAIEDFEDTIQRTAQVKDKLAEIRSIIMKRKEDRLARGGGGDEDDVIDNDLQELVRSARKELRSIGAKSKWRDAVANVKSTSRAFMWSNVLKDVLGDVRRNLRHVGEPHDKASAEARDRTQTVDGGGPAELQWVKAARMKLNKAKRGRKLTLDVASMALAASSLAKEEEADTTAAEAARAKAHEGVLMTAEMDDSLDEPGGKVGDTVEEAGAKGAPDGDEA